MPFFARVFRGKDFSSNNHPPINPKNSKKSSKSSKSFPPAVVQDDPPPPRPLWSDAWLRPQVEPHEVQELLHQCTKELKARALATPLLLLPFRPTSNPSAARSFIRNYFKNPFVNAPSLHGDDLIQELRLAEPMVLCSVMKWCWSRLPGGVVTWEAYHVFKTGEHDSDYIPDAFFNFIPMSVESDARSKIIFDFFDVLTAIAAHSKSNGLGGRKLSRYAGWWAFEHKDTGKGFEAAYKNWTAAADATSHLFFAYLRSISPDSSFQLSGISSLPIALQSLLEATEYPPETPALLQIPTAKVLMTVDAVSPTPLALLHRPKNFQYHDSDNNHLQEIFFDYDDPVHALTDECLRVLKCISNANQANISSTKTSTSLRDAAWSRFEDLGFGAPIDSDSDDEKNAVALARAEFGSLNPSFSDNTQHNGGRDLNRPSTPSWADFMATGFVGSDASGNLNGNSVAGSYNPTPPLLLPPDKVLPPIPTSRGQTSQSDRRNLDTGSSLDPGELASITNFQLDDSFWWVWISSLAGEEPASRKAVFGRCALIETVIQGAKWIILEEKVRGAVTDRNPEPGVLLTQNNRSGFFGSFAGRRGKMDRMKSTKLSKTMSAR